MDQFIGSLGKLNPVLELAQHTRYDLLFVLSTAMYHSLDYFNANNLDTKSNLFIFNIFTALDLNIAMGFLALRNFCLNAVSLTICLKILFDIFCLEQTNYLTQILYQIILPLQTHCFIRVVSKFANPSSDPTFQTHTILGVLFVFALMQFVNLVFRFSFFLVCFLKIKLNLRYGLSRQANFYSLSQSQFFLNIGKMFVGAFFSLLIQGQFFLYLIAIGVTNCASNFLFAMKVHYDNPKNQFFELVSQFYRWVPVVLGAASYTNASPLTIEILSNFSFIVFLRIVLTKPRHLTILLQNKYISAIQNFAEIRSKANQFKGNKFNHTEITISYLSIAFNIFFKANCGLKWSDNFKTIVLKSLVKYVQDTERLNLERKGTQIIRKAEARRTRKTTFLDTPETYRIAEQVKEKYKSEFFHQTFDNYEIESLNSQNVTLYNKLWAFAIFIIPEQSNVPSYLHFLCDNLTDTTNLMKHQLIYFSFLIQSNSKSFFQKMDARMCHSRLINLIAKQEINLERNYGTEMFDRQRKSPIVVNNQEAVVNYTLAEPRVYEGTDSEALENSEVYCFHLEQPYFSNKFNHFILESQLFTSIIEHLAIFSKNQSFYSLITESKNQEKYRITEYFLNRNSISRRLEEMIDEYSTLKEANGKIYKSSVINFIKNNWIRKDPIMALEEFRAELQNYTHSQITHVIKTSECFNSTSAFDNSFPQKLVCMVSSIANPDKIFVSSPEFKKLLQTDNEPCDTDDSAQIMTKVNTQCQINLNSLMLPIFKEQHQNLSSNFYEKPVPHLEKRYFLLSKRRTNVLETKLKMYFHKMFENDLLIVLDMRAEKLAELIITDKDKRKVLFEHTPNRLSMMAQTKKSLGKNGQSNIDQIKSYRRRSSIYPEMKETVGTRLKGMKTEFITLFNREYHIFVKKMPEKRIFENLASLFLDEKSGTHNNLTKDEKEKQDFEKSKRLKEFKLMKYKENFSKTSTSVLSFVFYLLFFVGCVVTVIMLIINQEHKSLQEIMLVINDKVKLEESYGKENIYRSIDFGLMVNMYVDQIDLSKMDAVKVVSLTEHVQSSMKNSIDAMKVRHQFNPFTIDNTIRATKYWIPGWIGGEADSLEMGSYKGEVTYIESVRNYFIIEELPEPDVAGDPTKTHDLDFTKKLPKHQFNQVQKLKDFKYVINVINDQLKYIKPDGVFARFRQSQNQVLSSILKNKEIMIEILILLGIVFGALRLTLTVRAVRALGKKYEISLGTSKKFRVDFNRSNSELKKCIEEMRKFSQDTTFRILRQQPFNYKQIEERKEYTVKSIQTCSEKDTMNTKFTYSNNKKGKKQPVDQERSLSDLTGKPFTSSLSRFLFSFMKYPIFAAIAIVIVCSQNFINYSNKVASIQVYSQAIEKLSSINFEVLSLMSQNLFLFSLDTLKLQPNAGEDQMKQFIDSFTKTITQVSTTDKANIISEMFVDASSDDNTVQKILYHNICKEFPVEVNCPEYIVPKINGMVEKYGQTLKNINLLFHKITSSGKTSTGMLDTSNYQERYIETYENVNQLMYINKKIRTMSFANLQEKIGAKVFTSLTEKVPPVNKFESDFYLIFCLTGVLVLEAIMYTVKLYQETKIVSEEFLRVGTSTMMENEKNIVDGYVRFFNMAQTKEWLKKD